MTTLEAKKIRDNYYDMTNPSEDDKFLYTEDLKAVLCSRINYTGCPTALLITAETFSTSMERRNHSRLQ